MFDTLGVDYPWNSNYIGHRIVDNNFNPVNLETCILVKDEFKKRLLLARPQLEHEYDDMLLHRHSQGKTWIR